MAFEPKKHLTNLKGKEYLEVKWRLVWFKEEHPHGSVETEVILTDPVIIRATICAEGGVKLATGHGSAVAKQGAVWAGREIEKAETAAIGRALAHAGYGTQFTDEDERDYLADSPTERKQPAPRSTTASPAPSVPPDDFAKQFPAAGQWTADQLWPLVEPLYGGIRQHFMSSIADHSQDLEGKTLNEAVDYLNLLHWNMSPDMIKLFKQETLSKFGVQGEQLIEALANGQRSPFKTWKDWKSGSIDVAYGAVLAYVAKYDVQEMNSIAESMGLFNERLLNAALIICERQQARKAQAS